VTERQDPIRVPGWLIDVPVLIVALVTFLALAAHQIKLPGLHTDEALEVLPAMQLVRGQEVECFKDVCVNVFGLRLPVMIYEYIATVNTYMAIPFFALFGISVPVLRTMSISQSVVAMVFLYMLARELYSRRVAVMAVLLLAVSPSFVFWSRQGVFVTSVTIPISLIGAWTWLRWWRSGKRGYLYFGAFLFGLGISAKFLFGWLLAGIGGAFVLLIFNVRTMSTINYIRANVLGTSYYDVDNTKLGENLRERVKELRSVLNGETFWYLGINPYASWRYPSVFLIAIGIAAFSMFGSRRQAGRDMLPTWITVAGTVLISYGALFFLPLHASRWYLIIPAIGLGISVLVSLFVARGKGWAAWATQIGAGLAAALFFVVYVYLGWKMTQWWLEWKVYITGVVTLVLAPWLRAREDARKVMFPVLVITGMMFLSVFTPTALWHTHLAILTPWPYLTIAVIADMVVRRLGLDRLYLGRMPVLSGQVGATACSLGLLVMLALGLMLVHDDLEVDEAYHRELRIIGGKFDHSYASYRLVDYLQEHKITDVVAMDWGIQDVVQFLSEGEINPPEIFGHLDRENVDPAFAIRVREQLEDPDAVYVFRFRPHFKNRRQAFAEIVAEEGKRLETETVIYDWSGGQFFELLRVVR
jgi:hypothetical protein